MTTRGTLFMRWILFMAERRSSSASDVGVLCLLLWLAGRFSPKVPAKNASDGARDHISKGNWCRCV